MTALAGPKTADVDADLAQAFDRLRDSGRYQTEMEAIEPPDPPEVPDWLRWIGDLFGSAEGLFELLLWIAIAAVVGVILVLVGRRIADVLAERRARRADAVETPEWRPDAAPARALLAEAEALAAQGRFAEAAHLLLFRSIEDIEKKLPDAIRPALTSRDIARAETLPAPARGAFSAIAAVVERGIFASRPVEREGWIEARRAYEQFAFGASWA